MLKHDFISASANIFKLDPGANGVPVATCRIDHAGLSTVMSNSFGFGGTNATLVFRRHE
jgi:3-oxoacyl-[acyl-carrier-protein] synthase-1